MNNYLQLTTEQRLKELSNALTLSAKHLYEAAKIFGAMEEAEDDVSSIPYHLRLALHNINAGKMLPETYSNFPGRLRTAIASLPLEEQKKLVVQDATVPLLLKREAREPAMRRVLSLSPVEIAQVFYRGTMRTPEEQAHYLLKKEILEKESPERKKTVEIGDGGAKINGEFFSKDQLIKILGEI